MKNNENKKIEIWFWAILFILFAVFPILFAVFGP